MCYESSTNNNKYPPDVSMTMQSKNNTVKAPRNNILITAVSSYQQKSIKTQ